MSGAPFVGRAAELAECRRELDLAARGNARLLLIAGEAGVGKSRLMAHFAATARGRALPLAARATAQGAVVPFGVLSEALESRLRRLAPAAVNRLAGERAAALAPILPSVAASSGVVGPPADRLASLEALLALIGRLAEENPVLLLLDDAHQADPSTWELVGYVARNLPAFPLLCVAALRTEALAADIDLALQVQDLVKDGLARRIRLAPLSRTELEALAAGRMGEVPPEALDWIYDRSRGNTLYALALMDELRSNPDRRVVPVGVQEQVRVWLHGLPEAVREVVEIAAVLGRSFSLPAIVSVLPDEAAAGLDELAAGGLFIERTGPGGAGYDFTHPLVQEAAYLSIGANRRRKLHARLARTLVGEPLAVRAYHFARGALPGDAGAIRVIWDAAREAEARQAHREALTHLRAALSLCQSHGDDVRPALLDEIAWQASCIGDHTLGIPALDQLLELTLGKPEEGRVRLRLASFLATGAGDLERAEREAALAVRLLSDREPAGAASALNELAWIHGEGGDLGAQVQESGEARRLAEAQGDAVAALHAMGAHGHALGLMGRTDEAVAVLRLSLDLARSTGDRSQIDWHAGVLGDVLALAGRFAEAEAQLDEAVGGGSSLSDVAHFSRARLGWHTGTWARALADCRAIQALHPGGPSVHSGWTLSLAALIETVMGDPAAARSFQGPADRLYAGRSFYAFSAWHRWARGCSARISGDVRAAVTELEAAAGWMRAIGAAAAEAELLPDLAAALAAEGALAALDEVAGRADELAGRLGTPYSGLLAAIAAAGAAEAEGRRAEAARGYEAAAGRAAGLGALYARSLALEGAARLEPSGRDATLAELARLYTAFPAAHLATRVRTELRAGGSRGRRAAAGVGDLTARERQVAELARGGLTARSIAGRLRLSERTVETHLGRVYSKLGVAGRHELRELPSL